MKARRHIRIRLRMVALLREHPLGLTSDSIKDKLNLTGSTKEVGQILKSTPGIISSVCKVHNFIKEDTAKLWVLENELTFQKWAGRDF